MASLYLLIPVAILFTAIAVALFLWAVRTHQFDDLDKEGQRILFEQRSAGSAENPAGDSSSQQTIAKQAQAGAGEAGQSDPQANNLQARPQAQPCTSKTGSQQADA